MFGERNGFFKRTTGLPGQSDNKIDACFDAGRTTQLDGFLRRFQVGAFFHLFEQLGASAFDPERDEPAARRLHCLQYLLIHRIDAAVA